jgi:hypothetical protein
MKPVDPDVSFGTGQWDVLEVAGVPGVSVGSVIDVAAWGGKWRFFRAPAGQMASSDMSQTHVAIVGNRVTVSNAADRMSLTLVRTGLDGPTEPEAAAPVVVFSYPGRTQADAAVLFAQHARELASQGYRPISQSWGEGRPGAGRVFALGYLGATAIRPKGFLTVTYELRPEVSAAPVALAPQSIEARLATLERLRSSGTITEDEYATRRNKILDDL